MKVFVYFNLHRKCFSVKALEGSQKGLVIAHKDVVVLYKPTFKVSEAGRQRVLREKRKNVHAGVVGQWIDANDAGVAQEIAAKGFRCTYNPYKYSTFVQASNEEQIPENVRVAALTASSGRATIHAC